jgi:hypothetical protein
MGRGSWLEKTTRSVADGVPTQERGNEYEYECEKTIRQSKVDGTLGARAAAMAMTAGIPPLRAGVIGLAKAFYLIVRPLRAPVRPIGSRPTRGFCWVRGRDE